MKFWDLQYRKNTPNLGGIKMKKNLKSFGYKLKKNAILLSLLLGSVIIAGCKQPNGGDDYEDDVVVTPDNPSNPTNPDTPEPTEPDTPEPTEPDTPDDKAHIISNNSDLYKLAGAGYEKYRFESDNGTVDTAKLVLAKKLFGDKLADFTETNVNYILDFSNKSFANTTDEIESRSEYASKKGLTSSTSIITDENLTETIKIGDVEFITKPIYYKSDNDKVIQQAFKFGKNVGNVKVSFGNNHSMTEAYKGGIILENSNAKITSDDVNSATLTGYVYTETMNGLSDNSLMSKLAKDSDFLPTLNFNFVFLSGNNNFYGTGVDKIFKNYYNTNSTDKLSQLSKDDENTFDAKEYLNGGYMYDKEGNYNNNAYGIDINIALLMAEKLTREFENVNISGTITSDKDTTLNPSNVRFAGNVSGLNFTATAGNGIIDFAKVGPKKISAPSAKIIVGGLENAGETSITGNVLDYYNVDKSVLSDVDVYSTSIKTVYSKGTRSSFKNTWTGTTFKTGPSASTNQAWEKKGRGETVSNNELISKLDVKAKANNPLLQKLLDENQHVYG